ncbi:uncharacterized protein LOC110841794 [Folsomia candida]|uniref:Uncharacterized protein n=1 Tax=Folsomia candida TaxID=158441 RepID=A0A226EZH4_FOLCA|nr:uncharacterized protein LOC110841794 [Folsomia candida]OXA62598.1 hypothetical protein Fcan01_02460 [Folsomia candida]
MDNDNNVRNENDDGRIELGDEEIALRRNQLLMFGVVLLGILSICLAVSMPSDLELKIVIPSDDAIVADSSYDGLITPNIPALINTTNSSRVQDFGLQTKNVIAEEIHDHNDDDEERINEIVKIFMDTEEFEDFIIDIEIIDSIKRLRKAKDYKKRQNTVFDDLFRQIETHFIGDDPNGVRIIQRVGEKLEARARDRIDKRRKDRNDSQRDFIAKEIYNDLEQEEDLS